MHKLILRFNIVNVLGLIVFRILLDICYIIVINPFYQSVRMVNHATISTYLISWFVFILFIPLILENYSRKTLSANVVVIFACFSFIPTTSLMAFIPVGIEFNIMMILYWLIIFGGNIIIKPFKLVDVNSYKTSNLFYLFLVILTTTVLYVSGRYTGFRFHFGLFDIYDLRFEERGFSLPSIISYLHSAANVLLPVMLVYFLSQLRYFMVGILSVVILLNFGIGGHKSVLFMLFLSFLGYWFYRFQRISYFSWTLVLICVFALSEYYLFDTFFVSAIMVLRVLFIPAELHLCYYDFFSKNELLYFKQGFFKWLNLPTPYSDNIDFIIGGVYGGDYQIRANSGLFSDAYQNLGMLGVVIFPFVVLFILRLLDASTKGLDEKLLIIPILTTSMALMSTTFSTALLTNGLFFMMIILFFLPRNQKNAI